MKQPGSIFNIVIYKQKWIYLWTFKDALIMQITFFLSLKKWKDIDKKITDSNQINFTNFTHKNSNLLQHRYYDTKLFPFNFDSSSWN